MYLFDNCIHVQLFDDTKLSQVILDLTTSTSSLHLEALALTTSPKHGHTHTSDNTHQTLCPHCFTWNVMAPRRAFGTRRFALSVAAVGVFWSRRHVADVTCPAYDLAGLVPRLDLCMGTRLREAGRRTRSVHKIGERRISLLDCQAVTSSREVVALSTLVLCEAWEVQ